MIEITQERIPTSKGLLALSPLLLMAIIFVGIGIYTGDFYKTPLVILFTFASIYALCIRSKYSFAERLSIFSKNAGNPGLMQMVWIFILAGAFAESAKAMGAVEATVNLTTSLIPSSMILAGLFISSCLISISIGTSVGTIVALMPIAAGVANSTSADLALITASTIGGAFFGDNLSFISDTTVAATRTQGCMMKDKFRANVRIALPAALLTILLYLFIGNTDSTPSSPTFIGFYKIIPYIIVLAVAIVGVNVMIVLTMGIIATGLTGICDQSYNLSTWLGHITNGIAGVSELIIISLLAGGLLGIVKELGGISWIIQIITKRVKSKKGAELSIGALVCITNLCTANNTIAILTIGNLAQDISKKFGVDPKRSASLLDTFSCCVQGVIPYGIQILMASAIVGISPYEFIPFLFYPFILFICALLSILLDFKTKSSTSSQ